MTDLRKAAQMALDWRDKNGELLFALGGWDFIFEINNWSQSLRGALAQPEPEPVAWLYEGSDIEGRDVCLNEDIFEEQKPNCIPLYTAPPQREWQGLTDKEIENCFEMSMFGTCRAIEAKLKAKNYD